MEADSALPAAHGRRYADTMSDALERLADAGPRFGPGFAFHAPMAAEAMASLGYYDEVPAWIERNRVQRRYSDQPRPTRPLDPADAAQVKAALGDHARFADWRQLFDRELAADPWRDVLARWWPTLLPGLTGALGHGLIRTAHAVRGLGTVPGQSPAHLRELAQGLAFWAVSHHVPPAEALPAPLPALRDPAPHAAREALVADTAAVAGLLAAAAPRPTIPLVHTVTIPMAMDLLMPYLPLDLHPQAYRYGMRASGEVVRWFGAGLRGPAPAGTGQAEPEQAEQPGQPGPAGTVGEGGVAACVESAMDTGDEHAIKLADVCVRSAAVHAGNEPYVRAVGMLVERLRRGDAIPGGG